MRNIHTYSKLHETNRPWTDCTKDLGRPHKPNKLVRYAKKSAKRVLTPINTTIALIAMGTALSFNPVQAQNNFKNTNTEVTETAYGNLFIKDENDQGIEGATITWTPVSIPGDSIPDPYTFITNDVGISAYSDILVFHDTGVGVQDNQDIEVVQARPNPSTDFTLNFITNEQNNNPIRISDINGKTVGVYNLTERIDNIAVYHVDLSDKANGVYFATSIIDGEAKISKLVKINGAYSGNLGSSAKKTFNGFKNSQDFEAIYDLTIEAEGYYTVTDQRTVTEGDNGWGGYILISDEPPPIDNQDISGIVTNTNTGNPINNALIEIEVVSSGQLYTATSSSDGSFTVNNLPLGEAILFRAGGVSGKYSISDFPNETIEEVINPSDSVNSNFNVSLPNNLPASTTLAHAKDQNLSGTNQDTIWFYQGNSVPAVMKENNRNYFVTLQADENNVYTYAEKFEQSNIGINIEYGTYNTQAHTEQIITPLGNMLYPVLYANSTMGNGNYNIFVHEIKRALGYDEVAWAGVNSVMEAFVQDYTLEDKDIARELSRMYWNAIYQEEKTWIPMQYLSESMTCNKSSSSNIKDVKARIDQLNKAAEQKIIDENIPDYFN